MDPNEKSTKAKTQCSDKSVQLIYCYICQISWKASGFISHYSECKNSYNKRPINKDRQVIEPEIVTLLIFKLTNNEDITEELNDYNQIAADASFDLLAKECPKCHKKFLPDNYLKHAEKCRKRKRKTLDFEDFKDCEEDDEEKGGGEKGDWKIEKKQRKRRKKSMENLKSITKDEVKNFKTFNIKLMKYKDAPY